MRFGGVCYSCLFSVDLGLSCLPLGLSLVGFCDFGGFGGSGFVWFCAVSAVSLL